MGRLERKIKKQINKETEDFDAWYANNQKQLYAFSDGNETVEHSTGNSVIAISKRVVYPLIACMSCLVICLTTFLVVFMANRKNDIDLNFGDESVYNIVASEDVLQTAIGTYPFISKMQITTQSVLLLREDNSLVFLILDGQFETENDYYFINIQVEYNKHYDFVYKSVYYDLKNQTVIDDWKVSYEQGLNDSNDLYVYYLLLESNDAQNVYIEVHCFENNPDYFLMDFFE